MLRLLGKTAEFLLFALIVYPVIGMNWLFETLSGEGRWKDEQQKRMTEGREPLSDADFAAGFPSQKEDSLICLAVRDAFAFHCGLPNTAIYPDDSVAVLLRLMSPWAGLLDIIFRVEDKLGIEISADKFHQKWREAERSIDDVRLHQFGSIVVAAAKRNEMEPRV